MFHEVSKEMNPPNAKVNNTWSMMNISKHKIESTIKHLMNISKHKIESTIKHLMNIPQSVRPNEKLHGLFGSLSFIGRVK